MKDGCLPSALLSEPEQVQESVQRRMMMLQLQLLPHQQLFYVMQLLQRFLALKVILLPVHQEPRCMDVLPERLRRSSSPQQFLQR